MSEKPGPVRRSLDMASGTQITGARRTYNRWVADETLEDFALRFTAHSARRWSVSRISNTAIGAVSFLALEAIGGSLMLNYGFSTTLTAVLTTSLIIFLLGIPICYNCAKYGVDIDLLTRGSGFGYLGSTITSLIYASFTFIFFAIEAAIMAKALELCFSIPMPIGYLISTLIFIPLVTHGITLINKLQAWTQPVWIILQLAPFFFLIAHGTYATSNWTEYTGLLGPVDGSFSITHFGAASAILFSLTAQIGEQVDYLRFLPEKTKDNRLRWWFGLLSAGPGWIIFGAIKVLAGSFLAYFAFQAGVSFSDASEPAHMYLVAFANMISNPEIALGLTGIFVVICQIKINVTNTYAGSIAWSNFFSRLTHSHPGRVVWVVFNVIIGLLLVQFDAYHALERILSLYSIVAVAWLATIVANLVIIKPLGLAPQTIQFKRAYLFDINPVGFGATLLASIFSLIAYFGLFGETASALYAYIALVVPFLSSPLIAFYTEGKYYLARDPDLKESLFKARDDKSTESHAENCNCSICQHNWEQNDMVYCPHYEANICSLCCSLDVKCNDECKPEARFHEQASNFIKHNFAVWLAKIILSRTGRYFGTLTLVLFLIGLIMSVVFYQTRLDFVGAETAITSIFINLFATSIVVSGIAVWLFLLSHESRVVAQNEAKLHTALLMDEIEAHKETDRQLQNAKEAAESANLAKSKYIIGLSHELRTPLNSILGYAQLMERQTNKDALIYNAARTIRRSGDHLAGLIEGLLDISKIEAGRLQIMREKTAITNHFDQIVDMISLQARAKNLDFNYECADNFPRYVYADERRIRQVLINLLSNAVKFTDKGSVTMRATYRNQIATIEVEDTGIGIARTDLERIFLPFERTGSLSDTDHRPGTGLGLTITKLLVEIMGGELKLESALGVGSKFTIRLMLASVPDIIASKKVDDIVCGYEGKKRSISITDDDPTQRQLIKDVLTPLGFEVLAFQDGFDCLERIADQCPDLMILDIAMPGMDGWQLADRIRQNISMDVPIIIASANAELEHMSSENARQFPFILKPIKLATLLQIIGAELDLTWQYQQQQEQQEMVKLND